MKDKKQAGIIYYSDIKKNSPPRSLSKLHANCSAFCTAAASDVSADVGSSHSNVLPKETTLKVTPAQSVGSCVRQACNARRASVSVAPAMDALRSTRNKMSVSARSGSNEN